MRIKSVRLLRSWTRSFGFVVISIYLLSETALAAGDDQQVQEFHAPPYIFDSPGPSKPLRASPVPRGRSRLSVLGSSSNPASSPNLGSSSAPGSPSAPGAPSYRLASDPGSSTAVGTPSEPRDTSRPSTSAPVSTSPEIKIEPPSVLVPPFIDIPPIPNQEPWHMCRQFRYRLAQLDIDHRSLALLNHRADFIGDHRTVLRDQLQAQVGSKNALSLTPTMDHKGRIYAVPIYRDSVKEALIGSRSYDHVGWALVGIWQGAQPSIGWYGYALLDVRDRASMIRKLQSSGRVKALSDLLRPRAP